MSKVSRLEVKQLRILQALIREKNVSRVASQVGLTQQAVSDHLRKLRDIFDDRLFIRSANGLVPTPVAEGLAVKIENILTDLESLLAPAIFDPAKLDLTYTISATDYAQKLVLPGFLAQIRKLAPGLKINIRDFVIDSLPELMVSNRVNLALTFPNYIPSSYPYITLFSEHHVCVASKQSPLANKKLSLADISSKPQIVVSPSSANLRSSVDTWFEEAGLKRNIVISAPCFSVVPGYIETTDAIGFLPSRALPNDKIIQLDIAEKPIEFEVVVAWHPRSSQDPLHNWIIGLFKKEYGLS